MVRGQRSKPLWPRKQIFSHNSTLHSLIMSTFYTDCTDCIDLLWYWVVWRIYVWKFWAYLQQHIWSSVFCLKLWFCYYCIHRHYIYESEQKGCMLLCYYDDAIYFSVTNLGSVCIKCWIQRSCADFLLSVTLFHALIAFKANFKESYMAAFYDYFNEQKYADAVKNVSVQFHFLFHTVNLCQFVHMGSNILFYCFSPQVWRHLKIIYKGRGWI